MHPQPLVTGPVERRRPVRLRADQYPLVAPPERHLAPAPLQPHRQELEGAERLPRHRVVRDPEAGGDRGAVAVVPVEQLDHACDVFQLVDARPVYRIDQPRAGVGGERMGAALHELLLDPLRYAFHDSTQRSKYGKSFARAVAISSSTSNGMRRNSIARLSSSTSAYSHQRPTPTAPTQNHNVLSKRRNHCWCTWPAAAAGASTAPPRSG